MNLTVAYEPITELLRNAYAEGRQFLYEYEVYNLLSLSGSETPPKCSFIPRNARLADEEAMAMPGDKAVLKIVSPTIIHKTEVGGVRIVPKTPDKVRSAVRRMLSEVPERYAEWIERHPSGAPKSYRGLEGAALQNAIASDLKGVLQVQFMPPDSEAFGNELIVGLRRTREFGMVISAGLGGTDTELYAERFRKGQAIIAALTATDRRRCRSSELFRQDRLLPETGRADPRATPHRHRRPAHRMLRVLHPHGELFLPCNPDAPFIIEELEINPFTFTDYLMVPLDGMCRFSTPGERPAPRPIQKIANLLHPKSIGIIGVSSKRRNFGRIILENIIDSGFDRDKLVIIRDGENDASGVRCVPNLRALPDPLDLFIVAIGAEQVPPLVDEIIENNAAHSVMLIPGGLGETEESREIDRARMIARITEAHKNLAAGGRRRPGLPWGELHGRDFPVRANYDTWFIPADKTARPRAGRRRRRTAIVSQSGAFLLNRFSQAPEMSPAYLISMGNQTDLTLGDMMRHFIRLATRRTSSPSMRKASRISTGCGLRQAVREAVRQRQAGRLLQGRADARRQERPPAATRHPSPGTTWSVRTCIRQAGAIMARNFTEFQDLILLAETFTQRDHPGQAARCGQRCRVRGRGHGGFASNPTSTACPSATYSETTRLCHANGCIASKGSGEAGVRSRTPST